MSGGAILMMIVGILIIWGGFAASVIHAVVKSKSKAKALR
ncbi:methionine/alanine import family NSS transporter small subunit [Sporosarcina sp. G11-34]|nr:methionine/alanine import family NSS transporter small subunit [Sporosarcina sp. G11-34]MCZ2260463.1 methionine/alanine import family NSS transporter small subunit [Sporosarcina sp. G11-34]